MKITIELEWESGYLKAGSQTFGSVMNTLDGCSGFCFGTRLGNFDTAEAAMREVEIMVDAELGGVMAP